MIGLAGDVTEVSFNDDLPKLRELTLNPGIMFGSKAFFDVVSSDTLFVSWAWAHSAAASSMKSV
jgi:hypothetical protein